MATSKTTNLELNKQAGGDLPDIDLQNENWDTLDEEVAARARSVNGIEADEDGDIQIKEIEYAQNLLSDSVQTSEEAFIRRTTGGVASIDDGDAWLVRMHGRRVHNGYVARVLNMTVEAIEREAEEGEEPDAPITAVLDEEVFMTYVTVSCTIDLYYTSSWSANPLLYGVTVTGTPVSGDHIRIVYVKEDRGTIVQSVPAKLISTGWNLFDYAAGYAYVIKYSENYGFRISGTYVSLAYSATLTGTQEALTVVDGAFTVPDSGYVWVTGGNETDTAIWMTWSDWTDEYPGDWEAYSESVVDLTSLMSQRFPYGLMQVGNVSDVIDLNAQHAISWIERLSYSAENLAAVVEAGREYECDTNYIYAVKASGDVYQISVDGGFSASDHGMEIIDGTEIPVYCELIYGANLKNKLERDVVTISQQTLTSAQQKQVRDNIGAARKLLPIDMGTVSALPVTKTASGITATMICRTADLGTPGAQTGDWTVTTAAGQVTIAGTISGSTTVVLYLEEPDSTVTASA